MCGAWEKKTKKLTIMIRDMNALSCKSIPWRQRKLEVSGKTDLYFQALGSRRWARVVRPRGMRDCHPGWTM
jgi:hypothetical protein